MVFITALDIRRTQLEMVARLLVRERQVQLSQFRQVQRSYHVVRQRLAPREPNVHQCL